MAAEASLLPQADGSCFIDAFERLRRVKLVAEAQSALLRELDSTAIDRHDMITILEMIEGEARLGLKSLRQAESGELLDRALAAALKHS